MTLTGFLPVTSFRFPLDALLRPYVEQYAPGALISAVEFCRTPGGHLPNVPLMLDSGGFEALNPGANVTDHASGAALTTHDGHVITPERLLDLQRTVRPAVAVTLDFPAPAHLPEEERERRWALGLRCAEWTLSRQRTGVYAAVQPGQQPGPFLVLNPDGLALGGLAPLARQRDLIVWHVQTLRALMPPGMPLHVFGLGHPDTIHAVLTAGATSVDSSSPQRLAASGRTWHGQVISDPAPHERLNLAVVNLLTALRADVPLHLHPRWALHA